MDEARSEAKARTLCETVTQGTHASPVSSWQSLQYPAPIPVPAVAGSVAQGLSPRPKRKRVAEQDVVGNTVACCGFWRSISLGPRWLEDRPSRSGFMPWARFSANELKLHLTRFGRRVDVCR